MQEYSSTNCGDESNHGHFAQIPPNHDHNGRHEDSHDHGIALASRNRLIGALTVTATIFVAEVIGAFMAGSLTVAADAGHMIVDTSGLVIALVAAHLTLRPRDDRHTWGWRRSEVIAAAMQAGMLTIICLLVAIEAVQRLFTPYTITFLPMIVVGVIGLAGNVVSMLILAAGRTDSLNMRAAFLEVANDALGSVAIIAAAIVTRLTGWERADVVASLIIAGMMAPRAATLLKRSLAILLDETPKHLNLTDVRRHMLEMPGVLEVHDLHVETIGTGLVAMSAHVTVDPERSSHERDMLVHDLQDCVSKHFPVAVGHSTFQLDCPTHVIHEQLQH